MDTVIDFSASVPSAASIQAAGHAGAVMYISPPRESWMGAKPALRPTIDDFDAHGLQAAFVWQFGKDKQPDVMRGREGGLADARAAQEHLNAIRCSGHPVFFAIDFDITLDQWNNVAVHYFRAAGEVLGRQRVGIYGHSMVLAWAMQDDVVATVEPGRILGWQTKSWSFDEEGNPVRATSYAALFQGIHDIPGPDGVQVDINEVWFPEWGWRALDAFEQPDPPPRHEVDLGNLKLKPNPSHRGDPHFLPDVLRAFGVPVEVLDGWDQWGMGDFDKIWGVCVHHTGANNTSAEYIARNAGLGGGLSSQIQQSRTAPYTVTLCGVGIAWHMGKGSYLGLPTNNANPLMIGWEPQSNGTDPWPEGMLEIYYRGVAAILWYLGLDASRCISHWEYSLVAQGKWDPGAGNGVSGAVMDMDHFRARVQHYIDHPPFMEGISTMALDLTKRYQYRTPQGYYEGDKPGSGTLLDVWLNTDTHSWVARVNTERILTEQRKQHEERREIDLALASSISDLAAAIRGE